MNTFPTITIGFLVNHFEIRTTYKIKHSTNNQICSICKKHTNHRKIKLLGWFIGKINDYELHRIFLCNLCSRSYNSYLSKD